MGPKPRPLADRFWESVARSAGCWLWRRGPSPRYGKLSIGASGFVSAHRLSWQLHYGVIPAGLCVLHRCDQPLCVRPDHLFIGTHAENVADRHRKGRDGRGVRLPQSKLTPRRVRRARFLRANTDLSFAAIGRQFNVSDITIQRAITGQTWSHVS